MPRLPRQDTCFLTVEFAQTSESLPSKSSPIVMEQILSAFHALGETFSFEIWSTRRKIEIAVWCRKKHKSLVTHLFEAHYPGVSIKERLDRASLLKAPCISHLTLSCASIFPIRRYSQNADMVQRTWNESCQNFFASLKKTAESEIRAIQIVWKPLSFVWRKKGMDTLAINDALSSWLIFRRCWRFKDAFVRFVYENFWLRMILLLFIRRTPSHPITEADRDKVDHRGHGRESASQAARSKLSQLGFLVTIRLVCEGKQEERAIREIYTSFAQFTIAEFNDFKIGKILRNLRYIHERKLAFASTLSLEELAGIVVLPHEGVSIPELSRSSFKILPSLLPERKTGILVGRSLKPKRKPFSLSKLDLRRHTAIVGKTGSGKSTFLFHLITGLIRKGIGVGLLDPHGDLINEVLGTIPKDQEVVLLDPTDTEYPIAFNVLKSSLDTNQTISSVVDTFHTLFAESWGPRTEYILTHAVSALIDFTEASMLAIPRILLDAEYRKKCVSKISDPMLREFWLSEYRAMPARLRIESIAPILNKINRFLMFPMMRNILGQSENLVNLRECMDSSKILLLNLPKGIMGEENSRLFGNFFLSQMKMAAFSRAKLAPQARKRFVLVIDELQHFIGNNGTLVETLLAEGRKYRISLVLSCQHLSQLGGFTDALFGNVNTLVTYAVGHEDAKKLVPYFPALTQRDMVNLPPYYGYIRLLRKHKPYTFSFHNIQPKSGENQSSKEFVRECSRKKYARPRAEVEAEISHFFTSKFPLP